MRAALGFVAHHVVGRDLRSEDGIVPVFHREELVLEQHVGRTCDVAGHENVVGDDTVDVEGAAAGVAGDAPEAGGQPGTLQPFDVADRTQRCQHHIDVERGSVGETGAPHMPAGVAFQRRHTDAGAEVHSVIALNLGGDRADHTAERAGERRMRRVRRRSPQVRVRGRPRPPPSR